MKKSPILLPAFAAMAFCLVLHPANTALSQDHVPALVPHLIVVDWTYAECPDIESDNSHALIVGNVSDMMNGGVRHFGPQKLEIIEAALKANPALSEYDPAEVSSLANFIFQELDDQWLWVRDGTHVQSGGTASVPVLINAPLQHMVARTGRNSDVINLGKFWMETISGVGYWADATSYEAGSWVFKESSSPDQQREFCLLIGYFRD